jgi:hypothetical protein
LSKENFKQNINLKRLSKNIERPASPPSNPNENEISLDEIDNIQTVSREEFDDLKEL